MAAWVYLSLELSTLVLFALTLWHAARRGRRLVIELLTATIFGILLEWADILLFGTYTYSPRFFFAIGPVPIVIGLCWAMIIYGAMAYTDQLGLVPWAAPWADALLAILLDLAFDAVAIRLRFWTWNIPLNDGYFGVPASNFNAWLYVALGFSVWTRWVRDRRPAYQTGLQLLAPVAAFVLLLGGIYLFDLLKFLAYPHTPGDQGLLLFVLTLLVFAAIVGWGIRRQPPHPQHGIDIVPTLIRWLMHGYFGLWLIAWLIWPQTRLPGMDAPPFLAGMALGLLLLELSLLIPVWSLTLSRKRRQALSHPVAER